MTEFRMIRLADIALRAAVEGEGPLAVMVHGFPESWYSWRHQMGSPGCGRWTQQERPGEVNARLLAWLAGL